MVASLVIWVPYMSRGSQLTFRIAHTVVASPWRCVVTSSSGKRKPSTPSLFSSPPATPPVNGSSVSGPPGVRSCHPRGLLTSRPEPATTCWSQSPPPSPCRSSVSWATSSGLVVVGPRTNPNGKMLDGRPLSIMPPGVPPAGRSTPLGFCHALPLLGTVGAGQATFGGEKPRPRLDPVKPFFGGVTRLWLSAVPPWPCPAVRSCPSKPPGFPNPKGGKELGVPLGFVAGKPLVGGRTPVGAPSPAGVPPRIRPPGVPALGSVAAGAPWPWGEPPGDAPVWFALGCGC
mmetsp:Transcript_66782/g.155148  ORF Transcript_66782/g.155148 Transcript_66782/m.155148 type:complete len:287 (+) Transcript_66782:1385-2245(+)